jgi:hypothetical protein
MGHIRLGAIPKTRKWQTVVSLIASSATKEDGRAKMLADNVQEIANQALESAQKGLIRVNNDVGVRYTFYLLTQLVIATRSNDWKNSLEAIGINLSEDATIFELTAQVQNAIDDYLFEHSGVTDLSEIAQQAAGEALATLAGSKQLTLFSSSRDELQSVIHRLSTKKGFSELGQTFFGRFMARFLNFYVSRVTAAHLDGEQLQQIGDLSQFNKVLQSHCEQSAQIVHDFCGEWYSKTEFQEGIDLENTSRFMAVALKKLQAELKQQEAEL